MVRGVKRVTGIRKRGRRRGWCVSELPALLWWATKTFWHLLLEIGMVVWIARVPVTLTAIISLLLWLAPQAQDLLVPIADAVTAKNWPAVFWFFVAVTLVWALPIHFAARFLVTYDTRFQTRVRNELSPVGDFSATLLPRALGLIPFLLLIVAFVRSRANLPNANQINNDRFADIIRTTESSLGHLSLFIAAATAVFLIYMLARKHAVSRAARGAAHLSQTVRAVAGRSHPRTKRRVGESKRPWALGLIFLVILFLTVTVPFIFGAERLAGQLPLAYLLPFVASVWLPILTVLAWLSREWRFPVLAGALLLVWSAPFITGDQYYVRVIDDTRKAVREIRNQDVGTLQISDELLRAIDFDYAVRLWKKLNCDAQGHNCERPIIIAASGGASRAGFYTATVIGALLDGKLKSANAAPDHDPQKIKNRIFAISAVSGSSVGAAISVAALAASQDMKQPCKTTGDHWHAFRPMTGWRECLQVLMSGDFLSAAVAGFTFSDVFRSAVNDDRAAFLERSWETHFENIVGKPKTVSPLACAGSLRCPFRTLRPVEQADGKVYWLPLLAFNGTSVHTGQRIVTANFDWVAASDKKGSRTKKCPPAGATRGPDGDLVSSNGLFVSSYMYYWLADRRCPDSDIRISTAAHNSARFPLVSPPGEIWTRETNEIVDRIVDGGYFENYGAISALEIANGLRVVAPELMPFILIISNDPEIPVPKTNDDLKDASYPKGHFAIDLTAPLDTIIGARSATGLLAVANVGKSLSDSFDRNGVFRFSECRNLPVTAHIRVWPQPVTEPISLQTYLDAILNRKKREMNVAEEAPDRGLRALSMSWWLSRPVQIYLDLQTQPGQFCNTTSCYHYTNYRAIEDITIALNKKCELRGTAPPEQSKNFIR